MQAKAELNRLQLAYSVMELTGENPDPDGMAIRAELAGKIGRTSVPAIFVAGVSLPLTSHGAQANALTFYTL